MTAASAWWRALNGPWVISIWSAVVGVAFIVPSALWTASYADVAISTVLLLDAPAAGAAIAVLWLAHALWLSPSRAGSTHRAWLALATFALVGLVRLAVMFGFRAMFGIEQPWSPFEALITGSLYSVILLTVAAVLVDAARRHALTMEELEQAKESLARATVTEAAHVEELQHAFVEQVLTQVRESVSRLREDDNRLQIAGSIQQISDRLVRASSHELQAGMVVDRAMTAPRERVRLGRVLAGVSPAAPVVGAVAYGAIVFTAAWRDLGLAIATVNAVLGTATLVAGNVMLVTLARFWWPSRGRLPLLFLSYLAIGLAAALVVHFAGSVHNESLTLWAGGVPYAVFMTLFMTLVASIPSIWAQQASVEVELAESVAELAQQLSRVRSLAIEQRANLAHIMHGGVQAELTAGALTITRSLERGDSADVVDALIRDLLSALSRAMSDLEGVQTHESLSEVLEAWSLALDLTTRLDDAAIDALARNPEMELRVVDVVSEALTNAVRHGSGRHASVAIQGAEHGLIRLSIRSPGMLPAAQDGLGSIEISKRCLTWSRSQDGQDVVLLAWLGARS